MREIDNTFAENFRSLRKQKGLTQNELLYEFNAKYHRAFTVAAISQYENGKRIPEIDALIDFADYFNVSVDDLLGKTDNREKTSVNKVTDEDIMFALFDGDKDITDEMFAEVKRFAKFVKENRKNGNN